MKKSIVERKAAIYLSRLHLFWSADRPWAETWLLPLLNWTQSPLAAALLWPAYLMGGRWNDQLLAAGLLEQYLVATSALASADPNVRRALASHMAGISNQSTLDLIAANWLVQLTSGSDEELRAEWFDALSELLRKGIGDPDAEWARWLSGYVNERAKGIPRSLRNGRRRPSRRSSSSSMRASSMPQVSSSRHQRCLQTRDRDRGQCLTPGPATRLHRGETRKLTPA